jgi:hypothetical protein
LETSPQIFCQPEIYPVSRPFKNRIAAFAQNTAQRMQQFADNPPDGTGFKRRIEGR